MKEGVYKHNYKGKRGDILYNTKVKDNKGYDIFIKRKEFPDYLTEYFYRAYRIYALTENFGTLPLSGGWAEQPSDIAEIINLFKLEEESWQKEQRDKEQNKS